MLGQHATFAGMMPGFLLFGAGGGLMNVPLTSAILGSMPPERSGVASAVLNASREVAGLLGITVIGAVLRSREGSALRSGVHPGPAFIDGYHAGLIVTIALTLVGVVVSYLALRRYAAQAAAPAELTITPDVPVPAGDSA